MADAAKADADAEATKAKETEAGKAKADKAKADAAKMPPPSARPDEIPLSGNGTGHPPPQPSTGGTEQFITPADQKYGKAIGTQITPELVKEASDWEAYRKRLKKRLFGSRTRATSYNGTWIGLTNCLANTSASTIFARSQIG